MNESTYFKTTLLAFSFLTIFSSCSDIERRQFILPERGTQPLNRSEVTLLVPGLTLSEGKAQTIESSHLKLNVNNDSELSSNVVVTLLSTPRNGVLNRDNVSLATNDKFTLEDVENGLVTYEHDGSETTADSFEFMVKKSAEGSAISGRVSIDINPVDDPSVTVALSPPSFDEDTESTILLPYTDPENNLATSCFVSNLTEVKVTTPCACDKIGRCRVGVTGRPEYFGPASFEYSVTSNGLISNNSIAFLEITFVYDVPLANAISPPSFDEDTETVVTLSYSVVEDGDVASSCKLSELDGITAHACTCDATGVCTVGVLGKPNHYGVASFQYTVAGSGGSSKPALATLTLNPTPDPPIARNMEERIDEGTSKTITLSYTDVDGDGNLATSCEGFRTGAILLGSCSCDSEGVCKITVSHSGDSNSSFEEYFGYSLNFHFDYTISSGSETSPRATVSLKVDPVNDVPIAYNYLMPYVAGRDGKTPETAANIGKNVQSILTLGFTDEDYFDEGPWTCALSNEINLNVTTPCTCLEWGKCTVGVTPNAGYLGPASFDFVVDDNGLTSNVASIYLKTIEPVSIVVKLFNADNESYDTPGIYTEIPAPYEDPISLGDWYLDHSSYQNIDFLKGHIGISLSGDKTASVTNIEMPDWTENFLVQNRVTHPDFGTVTNIWLEYPTEPYVSEIPLGEWTGKVKVTYIVTGEEHSPRTFEFPVKASHSVPAPTHDEIKVNVYILASEGADGTPFNPVIPVTQTMDRATHIVDVLNDRFTRKSGPSGDPCTSADLEAGDCEEESLASFALNKVEIIADDEYRSTNFGAARKTVDHFAKNYAEGGSLNLFVVNQITGGAVGFASKVGKKIAYHAKDALAVIDRNYLSSYNSIVLAHEVGHLAGLYHTAEVQQYMFGVRVPTDGIYYFSTPFYDYAPSCNYYYVSNLSYPVFKKFGGNAKFPASANIMHGGLISETVSAKAQFFNGTSYFHTMGEIIKCWNEASHGQGYPYARPEFPE